MAKLLELLLSPDAEAGLDKIREPLFTEVLKCLQLLRRFPELGKSMSAPYVGWRVTTVALFRIIYRITPRAVEILYVRHCRRRPIAPSEMP